MPPSNTRGHKILHYRLRASGDADQVRQVRSLFLVVSDNTLCVRRVNNGTLNRHARAMIYQRAGDALTQAKLMNALFDTTAFTVVKIKEVWPIEPNHHARMRAVLDHNRYLQRKIARRIEAARLAAMPKPPEFLWIDPPEC